MAVIGSICIACGMPVEHDHYVPLGTNGALEIYRASAPTSTAPLIQFGAEHEWLKQAVILPRETRLGKEVQKGFVEDGHLCNKEGNYFSILPGDDYSAFMHEACWKIASYPASFYDFALPYWLYEWKFLEKYAEQLFNFTALTNDFKGWMLSDPSGKTPESIRNNQRINQLINGARLYQKSYIGIKPANIESLLQINCWDVCEYPGGVWKYRKHFTKEIDVSEYSHFVCAFYDYPDPNLAPSGKDCVALENFLTTLYHEIETQKKGVHFNLTLEKGTLRIYYYAKDIDYCTKLIQDQSQKLFGRDTDLSIEQDSEWKLFWDNFFPINEKIDNR